MEHFIDELPAVDRFAPESEGTLQGNGAAGSDRPERRPTRAGWRQSGSTSTGARPRHWATPQTRKPLARGRRRIGAERSRRWEISDRPQRTPSPRRWMTSRSESEKEISRCPGVARWRIRRRLPQPLPPSWESSDSVEMESIHLEVRGRVQGVGFRWYVVDTARELRLAGWVKNRGDGNVELAAAGEPDALARLEAAVTYWSAGRAGRRSQATLGSSGGFSAITVWNRQIAIRPRALLDRTPGRVNSARTSRPRGRRRRSGIVILAPVAQVDRAAVS